MTGVAAAARDAALEARLSGLFGRRDVMAYQQAGSTMTLAHEAAAAGAADGAVVWAAEQSEGRGRMGRRWESPAGGAYFSIILRPQRPPAEQPQLSLVAGVAVAEAIRELAGATGSIRWPNDVLVDGLKVAGILAESRNGAVVIGIGINARGAGGLPPTAGALDAKGAAIDPLELSAAVYRRFVPWYGRWTQQGFAPIRRALEPWMSFGQPVQLALASEQLQGTTADVDEQGRLVVRLDSGLMRAFEVGEVTLLR
jgi:BirA family biotin operon repressor/biotin-[acetyl-CoA-carboxylase] ligase